MKKFLYIAMSVIVLSMTMASCEDWMDINTSPDNPVTVSYDVVLPSLLYFATQQVFDHAEYHMYLTQCVTTTGRSPKEGYSYRAGWGGFPDMNRHPHWRRHYYEIGVNCQYMIDDAVKRGARNYALIAHTLQLHSLICQFLKHTRVILLDMIHKRKSMIHWILTLDKLSICTTILLGMHVLLTLL